MFRLNKQDLWHFNNILFAFVHSFIYMRTFTFNISDIGWIDVTFVFPCGWITNDFDDLLTGVTVLIGTFINMDGAVELFGVEPSYSTTVFDPQNQNWSENQLLKINDETLTFMKIVLLCVKFQMITC